jgi:DNA-binding NarL/FixJ family response regulator
MQPVRVPPPAPEYDRPAWTITQALIAEARGLRERNRVLRAELAAELGRLKSTMNQSLALTGRKLPPPELPVHLSPRERTVLALIAEGYSSKQIAASLGISFKTAVTHRTHVMDKLKMHDIAGLTRFAVRYRLVQP